MNEPQSQWPREELRQFLDCLLDPLVAANPSGRIIYVNPQAEILLGWPVGTLGGQPVSLIVPPSLRDHLPGDPAAAVGDLNLLAGRLLRVASLRLDGSEIPTEMVLSILKDQPGTVFVATIRLRHEAHLSRWSELTATLFDTLSSAEATTSADLELIRVLGEQLRFDLTTLWALTADGRLQRRAVWSNPDTDPSGRLKMAHAPQEVNLPQHVLRTGEPLWVPDLRRDSRFAAGPAARAGLTTAIVFPVRFAEAIVGVVELFNSDRRAGDPALVDLVRAVSRPAGELLGALEQSAERERIVHTLETARERQDFVLKATRSVSENADFATTLQRLAEVAVPVLGDLCIIDVVDELGRFQRMVCYHYDPARAELCKELQELFPPDPEGLHPTIDVVRTGTSRWSGEMTDEFLRKTTRSERHYQIVKELGFESYMAVPLIAGDQVLGTVTIISAGSGRHFTEADLDYAEQLAAQVASVIDRAKWYQREHDTAQTLQSSLLPDRLPELEGVALAARYLPATVDAEVGGDWYDIVVSDRRIYLVVRDVEGHDMRAASVMGRLRNGLALILSEGASPAEALERLNVFALTSQIERLATVLVAAIDSRAGTVTFASAGHLPPIIRRGGQAEIVDINPGPPLGVNRSRIAESTVHLSAGEVVLSTDGLIEVTETALDQRLEELRLAVQSAPEGPEMICDHLLTVMVPRQIRHDDVVIIAAIVEPSGVEPVHAD